MSSNCSATASSTPPKSTPRSHRFVCARSTSVATLATTARCPKRSDSKVREHHRMGAALALAQAIPPHRERLAPPKRHLTLVSSSTCSLPEPSIRSTTHHQAERATPKLQLVPPRESGRSIDPLVDGDVSPELLSLLSSVPQTESPFGFVEVPERCVQQQFDEETGLYYMRNRYLNPALGKFIQKDPAGYGAGPNLYAYCNCDPINHSDPSGLDV